ncbi:uncharacterized protein LOC111619359 [Centruroides sculpturatus]|uniref:uncharacterized protein LOC111619359 n=1 Tax=Centruroides sculpturatus TaxID=218467 RepID=UPI000C6E5702|nr:uncharacterized protein LOC111619359 [Centruroides sculpturatus]
MEKLHPSNFSPAETPITYSTVLRSSKIVNPNTNTKIPRTPMSRPEVLLLYHNSDDKSCNNLRKLIYDKVKPSELNIGVERIRNIGNGGLALELKKAADAQKLQNYIEDKISEIAVKKPKKRLPNLIMYFVPSLIAHEELPQLLYNQNDTISENFTEEDFKGALNTKFTMGKKTKPFTNWVIEVTPQLRKQLLILGKVNLEWPRCRVADFCPVLQCYRCCRFGHTTKNCSQTTATCSHCTGEHVFKDCNQKDKQPICINCKHEKVSNADHNARDSFCHIYQRIKYNLLKQIDYGTIC